MLMREQGKELGLCSQYYREKLMERSACASDFWWCEKFAARRSWMTQVPNLMNLVQL